MAVYVSETTDETRGDHLRIVRAGVEVRLPLADGVRDTVRVPSDAPEWVERIARENDYTPQLLSNQSVSPQATRTPADD